MVFPLPAGGVHPDDLKGRDMTFDDKVGCNRHMSESDCLVLNVFAPATGEKDGEKGKGKDKKGLPVFFWMHGGGYALGTAGLEAV